jgi:hypothetical protein
MRGTVDLKIKISNYVPPDPQRKVAVTDLFLVLIGFLAVLIGCSVVFALLYADSKTQPTVDINRAEWRILYESVAEQCILTDQVPADCPASPSHQSLWSSQLVRGSAPFLEFFSKNSGGDYWMGVVISAERLKQAAKASARVLILPAIHGTTDTWVDGLFVINHRAGAQALPLQITLTQKRMLEDRDLHVAIRVLPYPHYLDPDVRSVSSPEGFFSAADADRLMRWSVFSGVTRHLIGLGLFLLLARILWSSSRGGQLAYDYIVGAQFSLLLAVISIASMDITLRVLNVGAFYSLYFVLLILEIVFVFRLTAAFLRSSRSMSKLQFAMLVVLSSLIYLFTPWIWIESRGIYLMTTLVLPFAYGISAIFVGYRAMHMLRQVKGASRERVEFLFISSYSLGLTAVCYAIESYKNPGSEFHWSRSLNLITIYFLIRLIARNQQPKQLSTN